MPTHRLLPLLILVVALPALAAPDPTVEVTGFGAVPLEDARATCTNGVGIGALAKPGNGERRAALVEWGRLQLAEFGPKPEGWPRSERDLTYTRIEVPWVPRGVVTACWAVGRHDVARGLELRALCDDDRARCRDAFEPSERELVKDALRAKVKNRHDGMFAALSQLPDLASWQPPSVSLEKACTWPQQASAAGRFIDTDDLQAARSACVQLLELVTGNAAAEVSALPCSGGWAQVPADVLPTPDTDLGVLAAIEVASSSEVQLATLQDKLTRMNPAATCDASAAPPELQPLAAHFGSTWTEGLTATFRDAQAAHACGDDGLPLTDRLSLCPTLVESSERSCSGSEHTSCDLLAQLYLEGHGVEANEDRAFDLWQASCNAAHAPACDALRDRADRIRGWFSTAIEAAASTEAPQPGSPDLDDAPFVRAGDLIAQFGTALGPDWVGEAARQLFAAAITAQRAKQAGDILILYGPTLGEPWKTEANEELGELRKELEKRSTP